MPPSCHIGVTVITSFQLVNTNIIFNSQFLLRCIIVKPASQLVVNMLAVWLLAVVLAQLSMSIT